MTEPWMIDELAHAGPEHLDPTFVAGYDRKQGYPDPGEDLAIFEANGLGRTSAVLDLGAGSGQFALAAARRFGHVTAVDVSPVMNALLRQRGLRRAHPHRVQHVPVAARADARRDRFPDRDR